MKIIDLKKIINIKNKKDLKKYKLNKPIFYNNFLFHYLIIFGKLDILKLFDFPVYIFNEEKLDGFMLAVKYGHLDILYYLLNKYKNYVNNHNTLNQHFINFFSNYNDLIQVMKDFKDIPWISLFNIEFKMLFFIIF